MSSIDHCYFVCEKCKHAFRAKCTGQWDKKPCPSCGLLQDYERMNPTFEHQLIYLSSHGIYQRAEPAEYIQKLHETLLEKYGDWWYNVTDAKMMQQCYWAFKIRMSVRKDALTTHFTNLYMTANQ